MHRMINEVGSVVVIAYREDVTPLAAALEADGFRVTVQRGSYTPEEMACSASVRCLLNHAKAWRDAASRKTPTLIVEADFVPCRGFGSLPPPFPARCDKLFAWLYSVGSTLYGADRDGFTFGHGNTMVAYILSPDVAAMLATFVEQEKATHDFSQHVSWDTRLGIFLRKQMGVRCFIPTVLCGEHGGIPNPEHRRAGFRDWHQADILAAPLAFLPSYARGSWLRYRAIRLRGWLRGWARVVTLRYYDPRHINDTTERGRWAMARIALTRLLRDPHPVETDAHRRAAAKN